MYVMLLGPLRVLDAGHHPGGRTDDARELDLGGPRNRALVARLAMEAGQPVAARVLIEDLWGADVPGDAPNALQSVVSRTRRRLPAGVLRSTPAGYVLHAEVDLDEFRRLATAGRVTEALALWHGEALADLHAFPFAQRAAIGLTETRLAAVEQALAERPPDADVVADLVALIGRYPYRDRLWLLYLRTLAACGRVSEALTAYERLRERLAEDLGADPAPELRQLHAQILRGTIGRQGPARSDGTAGRQGPARSDGTIGRQGPARSDGTAGRRRGARLPAAITSFVGRDRAVAEVRAALAEHRLVTVLGPGGAGKTRLAVEAARACLEEFEEIWLVELAQLTGEEDVVPAVGAAMGLLEVSVLDRSAAQRHDLRLRLSEAVGTANGLLVLDNCEHLVDAVAPVAEELLARGAGLRILATSREALRITGECAYPLGPLTVPTGTTGPAEAARCSAVQLFVERARACDLSFVLDAGSLPPVVEICRRLDGQPLAIELAAARLRTMTVEQVADRLSDRFRLLTGGSRTALPRHRTLRAVVEWSWDLLSERERDLVERVAVFPGGVTPAGAAAVRAPQAPGAVRAPQAPGAVRASGDPGDTAELLESLTDKSLLVPVRGGEQRFRMLETLREYGVERLVERGIVEQVRRAHLEHFLGIAENLADQMRGGRQVDAIAAIDVERGNLVAALRFAIDRADRARAGRLVRSLVWYWTIRNEHAEVGGWARAVLALPGTADAGSEIACAAVAATGKLTLGREDEPWRPLVEHILEQWEAHRPNDPFTAVVMATLRYLDLAGDLVLPEPPDLWTRSAIGLMQLVLMENAGRTGDAGDLLTETVDGFRACGDAWGLATALGTRGMLDAYDGAFDRALAAWEEAIPLLLSLGADEDVAFSRLRLLSLRLATADEAQLAELRRELTADLTAARERRNRSALRLALVGLGHLERVVGDPLASAAHLRTLVADLEEYDDFDGGQFGALASAALAAALASAGDLAGARVELDRSVKIALGTRDMPVVAYVACVAAALAHCGGAAEPAARLLGAAVAIRGRDDLSNREAQDLARRLRESLGAARYDELVAEGAAMERGAALALLAPAP